MASKKQKLQEDAAPQHDENAPQGVSDYELQRLERIKRNQERLAELQLLELGQELKNEMAQAKAKPPRAATVKGITKKRTQAPSDAPRRISSRLRGQPADELALSMTEEGEVVKIGGEVLRLKASAARLALVRQDSGVSLKAYSGRHNPDPQMPFSSQSGSAKWQEGTDHQLLDLLRTTAGVAAVEVPAEHAKEGPSQGPSEGPSEGPPEEGPAASAAPVANKAPSSQCRVPKRKQTDQESAFATVSPAVSPAASPKPASTKAASQRAVSGNAASRKTASKQSASPAASASTQSGPKGATMTQILAMNLKEQDVAKVTTDAITHLHFMPTTNQAILAAADKKGNLGFWHLQGSEDDIILQFKPHDQYICGLKWLGPNGRDGLLTCSYDGSVRKLDIATGRWLLWHSSEDEEYSACEATPDTSVLYLGDVDGGFRTIDPRAPAGSQGPSWALSNKKFNTLHLHPTQHHQMLGATSDGGVSIWDLRNIKKGALPVLRGHHTATCQSAYFCPTGNGLIASTSRDNTVRVWDSSRASSKDTTLHEVAAIRHNNDTGRWIVPFRATWGAQGDCILIGNMGRAMDVIPLPTDSKKSVVKAEIVSKRHDELMTAIPSRISAHPMQNMVAAATGSGRVHVSR